MSEQSVITPPSTDGTMSIWDHLEELRSRLLRSILALVVAFLVSLIFTADILDYLASPYTSLENG